jgi:hypothetical protein
VAGGKPPGPFLGREMKLNPWFAECAQISFLGREDFLLAISHQVR